jgi:chorismate mutase
MSNEKYTRSIELMNAVADVSDNNPINLEDKDSQATKDALDKINPSWDNLFAYIFTEFSAPETNGMFDLGETLDQKISQASEQTLEYIREMTALLRDHKQTELLTRLTVIPPEYTDIIFPVAIARYLLGFKSVPLSRTRSKTFSNFHHRYSFLIYASALR